jgi:hypothetical protein
MTASLNGSSNVPPPWLKQSVQQFLQGVNWDNQPAEIQSLRLAAAQPDQQLSLMLPVSQFLAAFNWDGAMRQSLSTTVSASGLPDADTTDAFTLDDLSELF